MCFPQTEEEIEDKTPQHLSTIHFSNSLTTSESSSTLSQQYKVLKATNEISASIVDDGLEASIELGVDATMARSSEDTTGRDLMAQHFNKVKPCGDLKIGGQMSAFRPIKVPETDEEKLESDERKSHLLVKPTPIIYVNDSELPLSPLSPKFPQLDDDNSIALGTCACVYIYTVDLHVHVHVHVLCTINCNIFVVKIFSDSMGSARIKRTNIILIINTNAVRGCLSENYYEY